MQSEPRAPVAAVVGAAMLFGTAGTALELGPDSAEPLSVAASRIAIGTAVLWLVVVLRRAWSTAAVRRNLVPITAGGVGVSVYTPLFLAAVERSGVAVSTVITIGSGPFFAASIEWGWRRHRPTPTWLVGTLVTVLGALLLVTTAAADDKQIDALGILLALAAGAGYGTYSVTAKATIAGGLDDTLALAAPFTVGAVVLAVSASVGSSWTWIEDPGGVVLALYLGVAATGAAYVLFAYGLARLSAATTVTLVLAEPVTAALLAVVVLGEEIPALGWLGIAIVLGGLAVVGRRAEITTAPTARPVSAGR